MQEKISSQKPTDPAETTASDAQPKVKTLIIDLFAGLRTVHLAAKGTNLEILGSFAAEKCPFANH